MLRALTFVIGGLETIAAIGFLIILDPFAASDSLGRSIAQSLALILAVPYAALVVPALVLAARGRFLPLALTLSVAAPLVAFFVWSRA